MLFIMRVLRPCLVGVGAFAIILSYMLCFPLFLLGLRYLSDQRPLIRLSRRISQFLFLCSGLRWRIHYASPLKEGQPCILCANHSSYLDIPAIFLVDRPLVFVGKNKFSKIPLFGYMYKRMHILVNRSSLYSRYRVLTSAQDALRAGKMLVIFPEGGIRSKHPPQLASFQQGAARIAISEQVPIVPITIMYNWMIWPKYPRRPLYKPYTHRIRLHIHAPISTQGLQEKDVAELTKQVRNCIEQPLRNTFSTLFTKSHASSST